MTRRVLTLLAGAVLAASALTSSPAYAAFVLGTDLATVDGTGYLVGPDANDAGQLYAIAGTQIGTPTDPVPADPLLKFDMTGITQTVNGAGTLTLFGTGGEFGGDVTANFVLYALGVPYNPTTVTYNNLSRAGEVAIDTETPTMHYGSSNERVTFTIPESVLLGWQANPASNDGLLIDYPSFSGGAGHSDIGFATSDGLNPVLTFSVPEPASVALLGFALAGLGAARRRRGPSRA